MVSMRCHFLFAFIVILGLAVCGATQSPVKSAGIQLFEKGDMDGAIKALKDSKDVVDLHFLATAYERTGNEKEARDAFDRSFRRGFEEFESDILVRSAFSPKQLAPIDKLSTFVEKYADRLVVTGLSAKRSLDLKGASSKWIEWTMRAIMFAQIARVLSGNELIYSGRELDVEPKIIAKPRPGYTDEARMRSEQGTVELVVLYGADGTVRGALPLSPLRYGLTKEAYLAAGKIKFNPGQRAGKDVTTLGVISYSFTIY